MQILPLDITFRYKRKMRSHMTYHAHSLKRKCDMTYFKFNISDLYTKWTHWLRSHQTIDDTMNQLDYMEKCLQSIETLLLKIYANQRLTTYPTPMAMALIPWSPDITNEDANDTNNE